MISDEIIKKSIITTDELSNSVIASKLISLNNSTIVVDQLKVTLRSIVKAIDIELKNCRQYLDLTHPALITLKLNNKQEFEKQIIKYTKLYK